MNTIRPTTRGFATPRMLAILISAGWTAAHAGAWAMDSFIWGSTCCCSKPRATKVTMTTVRTGLRTYFGENQAYPAALADLVPDFLSPDTPLKDAWKHELVYQPTPTDPSRPYQLRSPGNDGKPGTSDDIDVWTLDH